MPKTARSSFALSSMSNELFPGLVSGTMSMSQLGIGIVCRELGVFASF